MRRIIKGASLLLAGIVTISALAGAAIWRGGWNAVSASHPSLAQAELPPLIPVGDFFANAGSAWGYTPSPDGKWLSWWAVDRTKRVIRIQAIDGEGPVHTVRTGQGLAYRWHPDSTGLLLSSRFKQLHRMFLARFDGENVDENRDEWKEITPKGRKWWWLFAKSGEARWTVISDDRVPGRADVYHVSPDGVGSREWRRNDGSIAWWNVSREGEIVGRTRQIDKTTYRIESDPDGDGRDWHEIGHYTVFDTISFLIFNEDHWLALSDRGRDKVALVRIDLETGAETVVYANSSKSVARAFALHGEDSTEIDLLEVGRGLPEYVALTDRGRALLNALGDIEAPFKFNRLGGSADGSIITLAISEREDSWQYRQINLETGQVRELGEFPLREHAETLAETDFDRISARDGLQIPVLLTLPKNIEPAKLPMVVRVHGGPASHVSWGYDHFTQFLANRGYAVLNVNYRGSTGFGKTFQEAGYREFGRKMQDDIVDAAQEMVDRGIADPARIAIYGGSFGGYSALMGVARDPGFFAAAIAYVAASDLEYQTRNAPGAWVPDIAYWSKYIGSADSDADLAEMRAHSPVNLVERIKAPVLLAHGVQDIVVDQEQSREFEKRLLEHGVPHEAVYFEKEGHGWRRWQTRVLWARKVEDFLALHLGGRSGGFHYSELGARVLN